MSETGAFAAEISFFGFGEYFEDVIRPVSLATLLGMRADQCKPFTAQLLSTDQQGPTHEVVLTLTRAFRAYSQFQDLLDVSIEADEPPWHRHFCYYESLVYLREALRSLLDGNTLAALSLLRPFQELSTYHLYWHTRARSTSYKAYYRWLESGQGKPGYTRALDDIIQTIRREGTVDVQRLTLLRNTLVGLYKSACTYVHTPTIDESVVSIGQTTQTPSFDVFFFAAHSIELRIRQLCYLYLIVYPMIMFPVRMHEKWGFFGPVGLFARYPNTLIVEEYLGVDNIERLRERFRVHPTVAGLLEGHEARATLTADELENSWAEFAARTHVGQDPKVLDARLALERAHSRALGWTLNYLKPKPSADGGDDAAIDRMIERIENW